MSGPQIIPKSPSQNDLLTNVKISIPGACYDVTIWQCSHTPDRLGREGDGLLAGSLPPHSDGPVLSGGHKVHAVGQERHAVDIAGVGLQLLRAVPRGQPTPDGVVIPGRQELHFRNDDQGSDAVTVTFIVEIFKLVNRLKRAMVKHMLWIYVGRTRTS